MSNELNMKLVEFLEDERSTHGGRFFEAGCYMALDQIIESDIPYIYEYGAPLCDKEKWLLDTLAARKAKLKEEHMRIMKRNSHNVCATLGTDWDYLNRKDVIATDLSPESFVFGQIAGVEKAMEIIKAFVKVKM